mmetsp:Transcript_9262/g.20982  ORF Transcript_9262/g.20982 Transcript_9262/m.20982 type:complete len:326 (-) Transcript_9262:7-984(-)
MLASLSMERWTCVSIPVLVRSGSGGPGGPDGAFVSSSRVVLRRVPRHVLGDAHAQSHEAPIGSFAHVCDGTTSSPSSLLGAAPKSDQQQSGVSTVMEFGQLGDYEHSPDTSGASQTIVAEKCCNLQHQHGSARTSTSPCSCSTHAQEEEEKHKKRKEVDDDTTACLPPHKRRKVHTMTTTTTLSHQTETPTTNEPTDTRLARWACSLKLEHAVSCVGLAAAMLTRYHLATEDKSTTPSTSSSSPEPRTPCSGGTAVDASSSSSCSPSSSSSPATSRANSPISPQPRKRSRSARAKARMAHLSDSVVAACLWLPPQGGGGDERAAD